MIKDTVYGNGTEEVAILPVELCYCFWIYRL